MQKILGSLKIIAILFVFSLKAYSQSSWPIPYPLHQDTASQQIIPDNYLQFLEDKNANFNFHQVDREPLSLKFHFKGKKSPGIDTNAVHQYWYRYRIQNTMPRSAKISLVSTSNFYTVFIKRPGGKWKQFRTGRWQPRKSKEGFKMAGAIPVELAPGEIIDVIDSRYNVNDTNFVTQVKLVSTEKLIKENYIGYLDNTDRYFSFTHVEEGFLIGVLLIAAAFAFFFYRVMHEKMNLYFALFLFFLAINRTYNINFAFIAHEKPWLEASGRIVGTAWLYILTFMIFFFREAYRSKTDFPKYDRYLKFLNYLNIFSYLGYFIANLVFGVKTKLFVAINELMIGIVPLSLLSLGLLFVRGKKGRDVWMFWAGLPFLFFYGVITFTGSAFQAVNAKNDFATTYLRVIYSNWRSIEIFTLVWLTLIFSGLLALRYNMLRKENAQQQLDLEHAALEREKEKNALIQSQKDNLEREVAERTAELQTSLQDLKSAQAQLIQAEKMASLGELTAGIAHEIQNPLNFVNNFSEVNTELVEELKTELRSGNIEEALAIATDLADNESRINMHGKRADAIVKGMLQHSRSSAGTKEETDINGLVNEFLQLAYHGFRTKEKSFHADLHTDLDTNIKPVALVPQDIGRVLLNIINNALYAVWQKQKQAPGEYKPAIQISTLNTGSSVQIRIRDNGTGITEENVKRIFQPFFTTKPTGHGTGLGLSLAYDIIAKAHGGQLKLTTELGKGTEFIIELPG